MSMTSWGSSEVHPPVLYIVGVEDAVTLSQELGEPNLDKFSASDRGLLGVGQDDSLEQIAKKTTVSANLYKLSQAKAYPAWMPSSVEMRKSGPTESTAQRNRAK